ncbi:MAG: phosphate ABC transporter permease PstA [Opitutales bacterium]
MSNRGLQRSLRPSGEGLVWLTSMGLAGGLIMVLGLLLVIFWNGITYFWPDTIYEVRLVEDGPSLPGGRQIFAGAVVEEREKATREADEASDSRELKFFIGNKDAFNEMFVWIDAAAIAHLEVADGIVVAERLTGGDAIMRPQRLRLADGSTVAAGEPDFYERLQDEIADSRRRQARIDALSSGPIGKLARKLTQLDIEQRLLSRNHSDQLPQLREMEELFSRLRRYEAAGEPEEAIADIRQEWSELGGSHPVLTEMHRLQQKQAQLLDETEAFAAQVARLRAANEAVILDYELVSGETRSEEMGRILRAWRPNASNFLEKVGFFFSRVWAFLSEEPRSSNTEGGVFPAIFGTFVMTVLMSAAVMPFGVIAAIYLREYATQGTLTRSIRIAINNLAGVPSIVYGVFGLGFFVYFVGDGIDSLFFPDRHALNEPVFGTGGILWASLTLALMTIPVVVVATEEALAAVPRGMREASLACGASKWQTIQRVVLPASASGILTGLVLAMARGAGEVAPLMVVGVIKYAPELPVDGVFPYVHLDRKFMHLGFHIFDLGQKSPDAEAVKPLVFATTLLLIVLVVVLNLGAIVIRNHLREKYSGGNF